MIGYFGTGRARFRIVAEACIRWVCLRGVSWWFCRQSVDPPFATPDQLYEVHYKLVNSLRYGVPQNRQRCLIVGLRRDQQISVFQWPADTRRPNLEQLTVCFEFTPAEDLQVKVSCSSIVG